MKFRDKLQKFMVGRYGPDELYMFLFKLYVLVFIINLFWRLWVLTYVELVIVVWMFYRFFSKKIYKRSKENRVFLDIKRKVLKPFGSIKRNIKDKEHVYKKCSKCKTTLKLPLPNKRGVKRAKCPKCGKSVKLITFKKQKIEVYRKKTR